jgi:uncharacterized peroxidase-related enzyme
MPRIRPIDPATATCEAATHLATTRKMFGGTPNLFTTAANAPAALNALLGLFASVGTSSLGAKRGEQIAIAIAQSNGCGYCLAAHTAIGGMNGLDPAALASAKQAASPDAKTAAILKLAVAINEKQGRIDDRALAAASAAGVTDAEVVEIVAHVALNVFTNYLNGVSQTEIDFPVVALDTAA